MREEIYDVPRDHTPTEFHTAPAMQPMWIPRSNFAEGISGSRMLEELSGA